jgi:hypothetical protein
MLFDGDLLLDMEMTIYEDLMVKCGGFSVTLSGSHFQFRTPFTSVLVCCAGVAVHGIILYIITLLHYYSTCSTCIKNVQHFSVQFNTCS